MYIYIIYYIPLIVITIQLLMYYSKQHNMVMGSSKTTTSGSNGHSEGRIDFLVKDDGDKSALILSITCGNYCMLSIIVYVCIYVDS